MRPSRPDLLALLLLTLAALAFFAPVILGGGWLPSGGGDLVSFLWPTYTFAARTFPADLPLWNPHLYGGAPLWADNQSGLLYPPLLLTFLLSDAPSYQWLELLVMAHIGFAGLGMYACLRLLRRGGDARLSPAAAAPGAAAWMFSDVFVTHQGNLNLIAVAAWLPLVFLGTWNALHLTPRPPLHSMERGGKPQAEAPLHWWRGAGGEVRWALLAGVSLGLGTLTGHAQMTYFSALVVGAAGLWHSVRTLRSGAARRSILHMITVLLFIALIAFGLSAAALLPALEMTGYTARAGLDYESAAAYSLPPRALIGLAAPWVYGRGPASFSGDWDRVEVGYMGALALALALWGAWRGLRRRDGLVAFMVALGTVAFLLALGAYFPLHRLAYEIVPGFKSMRVPARFVLLFNFAGAFLSAYAVNTLLVGARPGNRRLHVPLRWGIAVLVAAEVIAFGAGVEVQYSDPRSGYDHADAVAWLQNQPDPPYRIEGAAGAWQPDSAALHGGPLYDIYGISNPLALAAYDAWYWGVGARGTPAYNFLGAKYVVAGDEPPGDASFVPVYAADSGVTVYLNTNALPLAHLVYRAAPVDSAEEAWTATHAPDWSPRDVVYVEGGPPLEADPPQGAGLFFSRYEPNFLAVVVNTPEPAYLVLSEVFYPGWEAAIDGVPAPIYRANTAFRAVYVGEAGEHTITFAFRPVTVIVGLGITVATLLALAVGMIMWWRRGRNR